MKEIFGADVTTIMEVALVAFIMVVGATAVIALKNRIMFKVGMRNIPRRKGQSILIVVGLMLSTLIISSAFTTGDSIARSGESGVVQNLGMIDETVAVDSGRVGTTARTYFPAAQFTEIEQGLAGDSDVDGLAPAIWDYVPLVNPATRLSAQSARVLAVEDGHRAGFGALSTVDGAEARLADLRPGEIYLNDKAATDIDARQGDTIQLYAGGEPRTFTVRAVLKNGGLAGGEPGGLLPLGAAQQLFARPGQITSVLISNQGHETSGAALTSAVTEKIKPLLAGTALVVKPVKQEGLEAADEAGSSFATVFNLFGLFSIMAGVMLIFLIFVMLAAERKSELGMARAVGTQRRHIIQMLLFEGLVYDLVAAAVGSLLGMVVTLGMVRIMTSVVGDVEGMTLLFDVKARSLLLSYCLGMVVTFLVVGISAWRVSKINIVAAIRDLSEQKKHRGGLRGLIVGVVLLALGVLFLLAGATSGSNAAFSLGPSLGLIGIGLILRWGLSRTSMRQERRDRIVFTFIGVTLLGWWLNPYDLAQAVGIQLNGIGIEMFFLSGVMVVAGAVWTIMYNSDLLLRGLQSGIGRLGHMSPILATAVAYPMAHKFRTGITLAMFALVVFTLTVMSIIIVGNQGVLSNTARIAGDYDIVASVNFNNPIPEMRQALAGAQTVEPGDLTSVGAQTDVPVEVRQVGASEEWKQYQLAVVDDSFLSENGFDITTKAAGFDSARDIWAAVRTNPGYAVIDASVVPMKANMSFGAVLPDFQVQGVYQEDKTMQPFDLQVRDPRSGTMLTLKVIGVKDYLTPNPGIHISQRTLAQAVPIQLPATTYWFRTADGVDNVAMAKTLEATFLEHGMEAQSTRAMIGEMQRLSNAMNSLMQGFMGLGLVVGIAALGVIVMRAVVERRRQIGVLRAIGYQRGMVLTSFLVESSMITLIGVSTGILLGIGIGYQVYGYMRTIFPGLEFTVPWLRLAIIFALACGVSLAMALLPARQASRIVPAEALRYE